MKLSGVPGAVVLGPFGVRPAFRSNSAILADLATRGCAISFFTLARVASFGAL